MKIDLKQLRELMRALKQFELSEIEIEGEGERIRLRRETAPTGPALSYTLPAASPFFSSMPPSLSAAPAAQDASAERAAEEDPNVVFITSPFVGTFYRSPSPGSAPFVDVNQEVRPGQVLCIVEAMKLMNEIECELHGVILEVYMESGKAVEYGDRLFKVRKK